MELVKEENVSRETCTMVIIVNLVQRSSRVWIVQKEDRGHNPYNISLQAYNFIYVFVSMAHTRENLKYLYVDMLLHTIRLTRSYQ